MESKRLDNAALAAGISPNYINAHGKPQSIGVETKRRLLDAMHRSTATAQVAVTPVPNVMVYTAGKKMPLAVEGRGEFTWLLTTEEGVQHKGHAVGGKSFNLPAKLPEGYHTLTLTQGELRTHCRIIVAPKRCYEPQALLAGQKLWGRMRSALYPAFRKKLGDWRLWRSPCHAGGGGATRRRVYRPESDSRAVSGEPGECQSVQPVVTPLVERYLY
ncbi:4-alpha-glucanotransferase [Citrobacter braakii]|nr:4-alpha-glucanotransferase [Citrobacter braakii]